MASARAAGRSGSGGSGQSLGGRRLARPGRSPRWPLRWSPELIPRTGLVFVAKDIGGRARVSPLQEGFHPSQHRVENWLDRIVAIILIPDGVLSGEEIVHDRVMHVVKDFRTV